MKAKTFLAFYLSFLVLALAGIGLYQNNTLPKIMEYLHIGLLICTAAVGIYQGYLALRSKKLSQPADDELSLKVLHRAAMVSYLLSLNVWALLVYIGCKTQADPFILMGTGMLSMVVVFAVSWVTLKSRTHA